jgi:hypothetical protein
MIRRRAAAAGIHAPIGNHTFRATGITAYLGNVRRSRQLGQLEAALRQHVAGNINQALERLLARENLSLSEFFRGSQRRRTKARCRIRILANRRGEGSLRAVRL